MQAIAMRRPHGSRLEVRLDLPASLQSRLRKFQNARGKKQIGQGVELSLIEEGDVTHDEVLDLKTIFDSESFHFRNP
jgi:hypothetical protein